MVCGSTAQDTSLNTHRTSHPQVCLHEVWCILVYFFHCLGPVLWLQQNCWLLSFCWHSGVPGIHSIFLSSSVFIYLPENQYVLFVWSMCKACVMSYELYCHCTAIMSQTALFWSSQTIRRTNWTGGNMRMIIHSEAYSVDWSVDNGFTCLHV